MNLKKSVGLFMVILLCCAFTGKAQYRLNKRIYNYKDYVHQPDDRYNPAVAGVASFFVPGLGQVVADEVGRGLAFFGGSVVAGGIVISGAITVLESEGRQGQDLIVFGNLASLAIWIWSIGDAVRVAKVNNLAYREKTSALSLRPALLSTPRQNNYAPGLTLCISLN